MSNFINAGRRASALIPRMPIPSKGDTCYMVTADSFELYPLDFEWGDQAMDYFAYWRGPLFPTKEAGEKWIEENGVLFLEGFNPEATGR